MPATAPAQPVGRPQLAYRTPRRHTDIFRSEFWKLGTVRSTYWSLLAAIASNVALAALLAIFLPSHMSAHQKATIDSTRVSLGGLHLSQVAFGVLGVLVISSEYSSGMIRATLAAVPQRRLMLTAKTTVFAVTALITGIASCFAAYFAFQAFLPAGDPMRTSLSDPGVLRAVTGAGLYLTVLGLFGLGIGAVIRSSTGAVATLLGVLFLPSLIVTLLPQSWQNTIGPYLPMDAGETIISVHHQAHTLQPWAGFGVFCLYAVVALAAGFFLISRRDA
jgi:ABC-type transport system involved in multi-copper enzyme maturation permease subunit